MPSDISLVARRIREIRETKKLSRQQLADLVGVSYLDVYRIETGFKKIVSTEDAAVFAGALGVSVASLYREARAS